MCVTPERRRQLAAYVRSRITIGRVQPGSLMYWYPALGQHLGSLPSHEQIATDLLGDAGFRTLQLGTWLDSPSVEAIAAAVALVLPRTLAPEFDLIVAGLKAAADRQRGEAWSLIIRRGVGSLIVGAFVGTVIRKGLRPLPG